jgi:hypothetical protein
MSRPRFKIQRGPSSRSIEPVSEFYGTCLGEESELCAECSRHRQLSETNDGRWVCGGCFEDELTDHLNS